MAALGSRRGVPAGNAWIRNAAALAASLALGLGLCWMPGSATVRAADEAPSWLLTYQGSVSPLQRDRESGQAEKAFDLTLLIAPGAGQTSEVFWHVEENGRGRWPWTERFGRWSADAQWRVSGTGPSLLYQHDDGATSTIVLAPPFLADDKPLREGHAFSDGRYNYQVERAAKVQGRDVWQVQASNNYGPQFNLRIDRQRPVAVEMTQRVFMGMGQEYRLSLKLVDQQTLEAADARQLREGFRALVDLRSKLNRPERTEEGAYTGKQLAALLEGLPTAAEAVKSGSLVKLVETARRDLAMQSNQAGALERLAGEFEGRPIENFEIEALSGGRLTRADLADSVLVLHFWEYRDSPIKAPYGQTGYLDFIYQKRRDQPLKIYGVAVDARLRDQGQRGQALRSIRKFREFMNLSYPLLLDDGKLLSLFGDPRQLGGELPLFVVVGRDGRIVHYRSGLYEVDPNQGLVELDGVISDALKAP